MNAVPEEFKLIVKSASQTRFAKHCQREDVQLHDAPADLLPVKAHWMGLILIASSDLRILFKVHYNSDDISKIAKSVIQIPQDSINGRLIAIGDFMKEYCNLMGGFLKISLEASNMSAGVSLPLVTRGFDDLFAAAEANKNLRRDLWKLSSGGYDIFAEVVVEYMKSGAEDLLKNIKSQEETSKNDGVLEFL